MKASVVQLRYQMKEVLRALRRNERVQVLYHGKTAGIIIPVRRKSSRAIKVEGHPFFGMSEASQSKSAVDLAMKQLRGGRYRDL